jgi:hypothetical protein
LRQGVEEFCFSELEVNYINWKDNLVILVVKCFNLDEFKSIGLHEKQYAVGTWDHLRIRLKTEDNE